MFASREIFAYFRCGACGCLQIGEIPEQLGSYYPADYYSYQQSEASPWRARLRRWRNRGLRWGGPGALLARLQPFEALQGLQGLPLDRRARILDVGCGQGQLVNALRELGYTGAQGIDPFLSQDLAPWLQKRSLEQMDGSWDLIMLHHSLEHLPDPAAAFAELARLLAPRGRLLIRVPTVDSWAYRHYGSFWVQWDPPRHLYLFSRANLAQLGEQAGLRLLRLWDDSTAFQFWGSEAYRQGLPLAAARPAKRPDWTLRAARLNAQGQGDQIVALIGR